MSGKKKFLLLFFCAVFWMFAAVGCSSSDTSTKEITVTSSTAQTTAGQEDDASTQAADDSASVSAQNSEDTQTGADGALPVITEQVLVDQDGIKITATGYTDDSFFGDGVSLLIENNSEIDCTVGCDALIVNDYMISDLFVSTVSAGKKSNETMYLYSSSLKQAGIENVGKIEMYFHAYDDGYQSIFSNVYSEIQTSQYADMDTQADDSGAELYNEGGIRIVGKALDEDSFWGTSILLYIENNSGSNVTVSADDLSVNGFMLTPYFSSTVYDGKKSIDSVTILESELTDNNITSIEEVELKFHIYNPDTFMTITDTEPITFSAQ